MQAPDWEKIFAKHISERALISRINKERLGKEPVMKER